MVPKGGKQKPAPESFQVAEVPQVEEEQDDEWDASDAEEEDGFAADSSLAEDLLNAPGNPLFSESNLQSGVQTFVLDALKKAAASGVNSPPFVRELVWTLKGPSPEIAPSKPCV